MYLLDTDILSNILDARRSYPTLNQRILQTDPTSLFISVISVEEYLRFVLAAIHTDRNTPRIVERYEALNYFLKQITAFQILPFDAASLQIFQSIPSAIRQHHPNDCRIAATGIANGYTIITRNVRHFQKIPDVAFEDWISASV